MKKNQITSKKIVSKKSPAKSTTKKENLKTKDKEKSSKSFINNMQNAKIKKTKKSKSSKLNKNIIKEESANNAHIEAKLDEIDSDKKGSRIKKIFQSMFSMEDVRAFLEKKKQDRAFYEKIEADAIERKKQEEDIIAAEKRMKAKKVKVKAASIADILGFNPAKKTFEEHEESTIDPKWIGYYRDLIALKKDISKSLEEHTNATIKRSSKDDTGDLSTNGQHMGDIGTEVFERDLALNMVADEQEMISEIEEAIKRMKDGTYGICQVTGEPIDKVRLKAVPFARYSLEGQIQKEKTKVKKKVSTASAIGLFGDVSESESSSSNLEEEN